MRRPAFAHSEASLWRSASSAAPRASSSSTAAAALAQAAARATAGGAHLAAGKVAQSSCRGLQGRGGRRWCGGVGWLGGGSGVDAQAAALATRCTASGSCCPCPCPTHPLARRPGAAATAAPAPVGATAVWACAGGRAFLAGAAAAAGSASAPAAASGAAAAVLRFFLPMLPRRDGSGRAGSRGRCRQQGALARRFLAYSQCKRPGAPLHETWAPDTGLQARSSQMDADRDADVQRRAGEGLDGRCQRCAPGRARRRRRSCAPPSLQVAWLGLAASGAGGTGGERMAQLGALCHAWGECCPAPRRSRPTQPAKDAAPSRRPTELGRVQRKAARAAGA